MIKKTTRKDKKEEYRSSYKYYHTKNKPKKLVPMIKGKIIKSQHVCGELNENVYHRFITLYSLTPVGGTI